MKSSTAILLVGVGAPPLRRYFSSLNYISRRKWDWAEALVNVRANDLER